MDSSELARDGSCEAPSSTRRPGPLGGDFLGDDEILAAVGVAGKTYAEIFWPSVNASDTLEFSNVGGANPYNPYGEYQVTVNQAHSLSGEES